MSADILLKDKQEALAKACRAYGVQQLDLFGSGTGDTFDPCRSDLDFLVAFEPCAPIEHYERYFGLLESLEALFERHVDLVETSAMRSPYFIQQVNESRRRVYAA